MKKTVDLGKPRDSSAVKLSATRHAPWYEEFQFGSYQKFDLNRLATYAILRLHEDNVVTSFENVVVALFSMFPKRFCLNEFEDYPDSNRVNRALLQLRPKYRNWALGSTKAGYRLTPMGLSIAKQTQSLLQDPKLQVDHHRESEAVMDPKETLRKQVLSSSAFIKYKEERFNDIERVEVLDALRLSPYAPAKVARTALGEMKALAKAARNEEALTFLSWLHKQFGVLFSE